LTQTTSSLRTCKTERRVQINKLRRFFKAEEELRNKIEKNQNHQSRVESQLTVELVQRQRVESSLAEIQNKKRQVEFSLSAKEIEFRTAETSFKSSKEQLDYETQYIQKIQDNMNNLQTNYDKIQNQITGATGVYQAGANLDQLNQQLAQITQQQTDMGNDMVLHNQKKSDIESSFQFVKSNYDKRVSELTEFRSECRRKISSFETFEQSYLEKLKVLKSRHRRFSATISATMRELSRINSVLSKVVSKRLFQQKIVKRIRTRCINFNKKSISIREFIVVYEKKT